MDLKHARMWESWGNVLSCGGRHRVRDEQFSCSSNFYFNSRREIENREENAILLKSSSPHVMCTNLRLSIQLEGGSTLFTAC